MLLKKKCMNCGATLDKGSKFCAKCGTEVKSLSFTSTFKNKSKKINSGKNRIKDKIKNILFNFANLGLNIFLILILTVTTIIAYIRLYKSVSFPREFGELNDVVSALEENILWFIILLVFAAVVIFLVIFLNRRHKQNVLLIFADSLLIGGSLFLLIRYVSDLKVVGFIIPVSEMLAGAILFTVYSIISDRSKNQNPEIYGIDSIAEPDSVYENG